MQTNMHYKPILRHKKGHNVTKPKETYASYAAKNGIALNKADSDATAQYVTCYDYFGQGGSSYRVTDYVPDLYSTGWDNKFSSCCFYGIWNMYDDRDYNERSTNVSSWCLLHVVAFFHVASLFSTGVDNKKVGVDNEKALELTNSTVFHRGRQQKSSRAGQQNMFFIFEPDFNEEISPKNATKHPVA